MVQPENRFEGARVMLGISKIKILHDLKTTHHVYREVANGRKPLPFEWVAYLYTFHNIRPEWIATGEGSMFMKSAS